MKSKAYKKELPVVLDFAATIDRDCLFLALNTEDENFVFVFDRDMFLELLYCLQEIKNKKKKGLL